MEYGLLSIVGRDAQYEIELRANSDTVEYDGKEHSMTGFETNEFEIDGTRYTVTEVDSEAKGTEAGVYGTEVYGSAIVTDEEGNDVTDQFAVSYISGALTITKTGPDDGDEIGIISEDEPDGGDGGTVNGGSDGAGNGSGEGDGNINKNEVPYTTAPLGYWALFNLIMMILSVIFGLFMLVRRGRKKDDKDENESEDQAAAGTAEQTENSADDEQNRKYQKCKLAVIAAVILAVVSVIVFFVTEDLTNTMALFDRYTWIMAVILIGSVLSIVFGRKKADDGNDSEEDEAAGKAK